MEIRVLAIGDVVGETGADFLARRLRPLRQEKRVDFAVVNGENVAGVGLVPGQAAMLFGAGADVITLGNHTFDKQQIIPMLEDNRYCGDILIQVAAVERALQSFGYMILKDHMEIIDLFPGTAVDPGPDPGHTCTGSRGFGQMFIEDDPDVIEFLLTLDTLTCDPSSFRITADLQQPEAGDDVNYRWNKSLDIPVTIPAL